MTMDAKQAMAFALSYQLLVFNVDGTIAKRNESELTPQARCLFGWLVGLQSDQLVIPSVALITNQGSVGCRLSMVEEGWGDPGSLPDIDAVSGRLQSIVARIPLPVDLFVSYAWKSRLGGWSHTPIEYAGQPEWARSWRKPRPGMILAAMRNAQVDGPGKALVVGKDNDRLAALKARCDFMNSERFYTAVLSDVAVAV